MAEPTREEIEAEFRAGMDEAWQRYGQFFFDVVAEPLAYAELRAATDRLYSERDRRLAALEAKHG